MEIISWIFDGIGTQIVGIIIGLLLGGAGGGVIGYRIGSKNKIKSNILYDNRTYFLKTS